MFGCKSDESGRLVGPVKSGVCLHARSTCFPTLLLEIIREMLIKTIKHIDLVA